MSLKISEKNYKQGASHSKQFGNFSSWDSIGDIGASNSAEYLSDQNIAAGKTPKSY
jgi:hypothetical protein